MLKIDFFGHWHKELLLFFAFFGYVKNIFADDI